MAVANPKPLNLVVAYHEAGHAVVNHALGYDVLYIGVDAEGGTVQHSHQPRGGKLKHSKNELIQLISGPVAEAMAARSIPNAQEHWAIADDLVIADALKLASDMDKALNETGVYEWGGEDDEAGDPRFSDAGRAAALLGSVPDEERERRVR